LDCCGGAELLWSMQRLFVHQRFPTTTPSPSAKRQRAAGAPHYFLKLPPRRGKKWTLKKSWQELEGMRAESQG